MQQATGFVVLGSVDLEDQEGDRDGEDTVTERRNSGGLGQTGLIRQGFLDGVLVRHDRMLALGDAAVWVSAIGPPAAGRAIRTALTRLLAQPNPLSSTRSQAAGHDRQPRVLTRHPDNR